MEETVSPSSPTPSPTPSNGGAPPATPAPTAPPARPEFIPEKFFDAAKGEVRVEDLAKSYAKLESERPKLKDTLTQEIKTAFETERRKGVPAAAEAYKIGLPEGDAAKAYADIVVLDKQPGADFKPEAGKVYAVVKPDSGLFKKATALAHKYAVPQGEFSELVGELAREMGVKPVTQEQMAEQRKAIYAQLGEQGEARVQHIGQQIVAVIGEKHAQALDASVESAAQVEAIEALLEKMGQAKLAPGSTPVQPVKSDVELKQMVADERYYSDAVYRKQVDDEFKRAYGKR